MEIGPGFIPVFFILMSSRASIHYEMVFDKIRDMVPSFQPIYAIGDFEKASLKAFRRIFPQIMMQGCYFHFKQANIRKLGELGLKSFYMNSSVVNQ